METQGKNPQVKPVEQAAHQAARQETVARPVRRVRTILFQAYLLSAIIGFSILAVLASTIAYFPVDLTITRTIQLLHFEGLTGLMVLISWFGYFPEAAVLVLIVGVGLYLFGFHWEGVFSILVASAETILNFMIKVVVHRPRPASDLVHVFGNVGNFGFPSGHTMFYTAYFGLLIFYVFVLFRRGWLRTLILILLFGMVLSVGISRVYLGEHWASDVLAGYLIGSVSLAGAILIYRWGKPRFFVRQPVAPEPPTTNDRREK